MTPSLAIALRQLAIQSPILFAYLIGLVFSLLFLGRAPRPAVLAAAGFAIQLFITIAATITWAMMVQLTTTGMTAQRFSQIWSLITIAINLIHAAGIALLIAAIFVGRTSRQPAAFPIIPNPR